ncbi:hypothetical protein [Nitrosopumilus sp.]|uniref:hypothetical protein n=1 Tax=Nitrosopumilus sp. TaxID=2024843 RepID=UPI00292FC6DA|nr:hypothetical protein [Nitrosopumilus sp.]
MSQKLKQMIQYDNNKCFCKEKPKLITTPIEGEIICKDCGITFGYDQYCNLQNIITGDHLSKTQLDICQQRQLGTDYHNLKDFILSKNLKLEKNNSCIAEFTDVCKKLHLPNFVAEDAWKLFCNLKRQKRNDDSFTRAKFVCIAIYQTCQNHSIPYDELMVQEIVKKSLNVKNAPKLQNVVFKNHTQSTTHEGSKERFYLNLHISQAQKDHKIDDVTTLKRNVIRYYQDVINSALNNNKTLPLVKNNTDFNTLAKRAVNLALQRCLVN